MISIHGYHPALFDLRIVRIGQICGNSVTGDWTQDEMVPMIIKSAPFLNAVLRDVPDVSWIPSDVCADVMHNLISCPIVAPLKVLHVANPDIVSWAEVVGTISSLLNLPDLPLLPLLNMLRLHRMQEEIYRSVGFYHIYFTLLVMVDSRGDTALWTSKGL